MLRHAASKAVLLQQTASRTSSRWLLAQTTATRRLSSSTSSDDAPRETPALEDMPFLHHGTRPRHRDYVKFKSPRKRASKLFDELNKEAVAQSKEANPNVWNVDFKVGDAVEIEMVAQGGVDTTNKRDMEKIRGVVLGICKSGMDTSIYLRDVVFGEPIEYKVPLHCPLVKSLKVLESNFVYKGKRKVKRAKLYFLRDRNPVHYRVTKF